MRLIAPQTTIGEIKHARQNGDEAHHHEAQPLALLQLGLCRPHQELHNVTRLLGNGCLRAIRIGDATI